MSLKKKRKKKERRTMFKPAKYEYLADIVSLESPKSAQVSVKRLEREFHSAKSRSKKMRVLKATTLAANRATAMKIRAGPKERKELTTISLRYQRASQRMSKGLVMK
jgi:hypothetical protein